jgi:protein gp37
MATTKIEWCDRVWNPVRGCSVISPGCHHCYAMRQAHRFSKAGLPFEGLTKQTSAGPQWTGAIRLIEDALLEPLSWRNPQRIFVNSMSDLFHEDVPDAFLDRVMTVMALSSWHTFQVLTKRADRMRSYLKALTLDRIVALANAQADGSPANLSVHDNLTTIARRAREHAYRDEPHRMPRRLVLPLPNAWFGVSVEDQKRADERIPQLLETPAAVRFISAEPLLGPLNLRVDLRQFLPDGFIAAMADKPYDPSTLSKRLDWVIVGGESGRGARPFDVSWARSIVHQCKAASVPVFVKQLGADVRDAAAERDDMGARDVWPAGWMPMIDGRRAWRPDLADRKGGDPQEWPSDLRIREFPR